ncbi:MAG: ABC transporter permease subunit [Hyphomicrobiales bacterium]|nr:ABC transporter permease subunit [Hyphomicrobiales bacterium]
MIFRLGPPLLLTVLVSPVLAGLTAVLLPSFGYWLALGGTHFTFDPWRSLLALPALPRSIGVSLFVGFITTAVSLGAVMLLLAAFMGTRTFGLIKRLLSPLLSVPYVALAFGLAFVVSPSGLIFRLLSPWATGLERPPDLLIVNDPYGLSLAGGLVLKEIPFLFLMTLAALPQVNAARAFTSARTLGYRRVAAFAKVVMPRLYPQLRLPVLAVLAYGLSVVDAALVLGPNTPPTLAIEVLRLADDPDLALHFEASAAAVLQLVVVLWAIGVWLILERLAGFAWRHWIVGGHRHFCEAAMRVVAPLLALAIVALVALAFTALVIWSVAATWRFPEVWPQAFTFDTWRREFVGALPIIMRTLLLGGGVAAAAVFITILCLENETRRGMPSNSMFNLVYIPLLVPQIAFLSGTASLMIALKLDGNAFGVGLAHLVFVLPYVFMSLSGAWRDYDPRYRATALLLGASAWRALWAVRLPMLTRAILIAGALGFAISVSQYLATLLVGGGRFATVTTEAVSLAAGADRRVIGVFALLQAVLPFLGFAVALILPALLFRHRRALRDT